MVGNSSYNGEASYYNEEEELRDSILSPWNKGRSNKRSKKCNSYLNLVMKKEQNKF